MARHAGRFTRRRVLRTATAAIALPAFASLDWRQCATAAAAAPPKRLVFLGFGWGVTAESWYPAAGEAGQGYTLPAMLEPLARHKADFSVVQGLWNRHTENGHYGSTFWLTGADVHGQPGQSFHNSISVDQLAAATLGADTRFESLALDCGDAANGSGHGPGLSLSWDERGKPVGGPRNPVEAFHRLFSRDETPLEQRQALLVHRRSVLDNAMEEAKSLGRSLGKVDADKLDEYLESLRDIERRLSREAKWLGVERPRPPVPEPKPGLEGREEIRLMYDIILAALRTDSTRVVTYRQPVTTLLNSLEITTEAHLMSHYQGAGPDRLAASQSRDLAQSELLAGLLDGLKAAKEADGSSLFDHVTVAYGSNIRVGHSLDNCPTVLAGRGAGLAMGHNIVLPKGTPLCNAWLTLLRGSGVDAPRIGDSTGVLESLVG